MTNLMTTIFTKGDVKRKFVTIDSEIWSDISDLKKEIDALEAKDCLIVGVKTLKSHEINDSLYLTQYLIEYLSPKYEVIATYRRVYGDYYEEGIGVYETIEEAETAKRRSDTRVRIVKRSPKELGFK